MEKTKTILREIEQERINQIIRSKEEQTAEKLFIELIDLTGNAAWELKEIGLYNYETILQIATTAVKMLEGIKEE